MLSFPPSLNTQSWKEEGRVAPRHSFLSLHSIRQSAVRSLALFTLLESFVWVSFWPRPSFRYGVAQRALSPKILSFSQPLSHLLSRAPCPMCEIGPPERPSVRPVRIMRRQRQQPLEPLEVGRRLAAHSGTALVIFKAIIITISPSSISADCLIYYKKGSRGPCDFLRAAFLILLSLAIIQVHSWQGRSRSPLLAYSPGARRDPFFLFSSSISDPPNEVQREKKREIG